MPRKTFPGIIRLRDEDLPQGFSVVDLDMESWEASVVNDICWLDTSPASERIAEQRIRRND